MPSCGSSLTPHLPEPLPFLLSAHVQELHSVFTLYFLLRSQQWFSKTEPDKTSSPQSDTLSAPSMALLEWRTNHSDHSHPPFFWSLWPLVRQSKNTAAGPCCSLPLPTRLVPPHGSHLLLSSGLCPGSVPLGISGWYIYIYNLSFLI